jgi:hypothetical protein
MKKIVFIITCAAVLASCGGKKNADQNNNTDTTKTSYQFFGDTINEDKAMPGTELLGFMSDKDSSQVKFTATIAEVCQKKGCWMDVDLGNGKLLTVRFKDYAFFMPKDAAGRTAVMDGYCYKTIETVDWLKHKAKDAGKSQASIDSITKPDTTYAFEASGVIIK